MNKFFDPSLWAQSQAIGYTDPFGNYGERAPYGQQQAQYEAWLRSMTDDNPQGTVRRPGGDFVNLNGQRYVQVGAVSPQHLRDQGNVDYNEQYGYLTPESNWIMQEDAPWERALVPALMAAGMGLSAMHGGLFGGLGGGEAAAGTTNPNYWTMMADGGNVLSDSSEFWSALPDSSPGLFGPGGGLDPETLNGLGGMSAAQNGITGAPGLLSRLGGLIAQNPGLALRGGLGLAQLLSAITGSRGGGGGSDPYAGLMGNAPQFNPMNQPAFRPNPYLSQPVPFMPRGF